MALPPPVVRHMLLCDDVIPDPSNPKKLLIVGLTSRIRPTGLPFRLRKLTVYVELSNGRGSGQAWVDVVEANTGEIVLVRPPIRLTFGSDVLALVRRRT